MKYRITRLSDLYEEAYIDIPAMPADFYGENLFTQEKAWEQVYCAAADAAWTQIRLEVDTDSIEIDLSE